MILLNIIIIFILIGLNAFFVAVEFAAVSSHGSRLDLLSDPDRKANKLVHAWLEHPKVRDRLIAACQLGITVVSLALGVVGEKVFRAILQPVFANEQLPTWVKAIDFLLPALPLILVLIIITGLYIVLGEQVPKVAVLHDPEKFALLSAPIMDIFGKVFQWLINLIDWCTRQVLQAFDIPARSGSALITPEDLKQMVSGPEVEGVLEAPEREMLSAVIDFGELVVKQIMIPRLEIIALDANAPLYAAIDLVLENGITKIPVYEDDLDHITGILHMRDMIRAQKEKIDLTTSVGKLKREALFVPETISMNDLLREFRTRQSHIAIVMDEFGGTSGLVTLEDLLEEIVGDVRDSFETNPPSIVTTADGKIMIDGLTTIEEVNEHFGLNLSDPHYDTIAGFVLGRLGRMARTGDVVYVKKENIRLRVEQMDHLRIDQLCLMHTHFHEEANERDGTLSKRIEK